MTTLSELRELMARATKGRWVDEHHDKHCPLELIASGMEVVAGFHDMTNGENNARLIVAMHAALPHLLLIAEKAQAVVDRWDTPLWKDVPATAVYIGELRQALSALTTDEGERCE